MPAKQATRTKVLLASLSGIVHGACFPPLGVWPLAWIAQAPLLAALRGCSAGTALGLGWIAGTVAASIATTPWIAEATTGYFDQGAIEAVVFASLVGQVFHALPAAAFACVAARLLQLRSAAVRVLAVAGAWTAFELCRARMLGGAPWDLLAHALYRQPLWIQMADLGGAYVVSFVLVVTSAACAELAFLRGRSKTGALVTALAVTACTLAYGMFRLSEEDGRGSNVRVALVQGNVPNAWRVDSARAQDAFEALAATTRPVLAQRPDLVVWPENAVSFLLVPNPRFAKAIGELLGDTGARLLLGGPRFESIGEGKAAFYNSAYLLSDGGETVATYDKRQLVPFAEYAPIAHVPGLGWRFDAPGDYSPGTEATLFSSPAPFGVLICFEVIYPNLSVDLVRNGAQFLLNISNDAWFGDTAGLEQHFAIAVFRAVETRRALARATNTGVTGLVGPSGRILERFPTHEQGAWTVAVPLREEETVYVSAGDLFAWLTVVGVAVGLLASRDRGE